MTPRMLGFSLAIDALVEKLGDDMCTQEYDADAVSEITEAIHQQLTLLRNLEK